MPPSRDLADLARLLRDRAGIQLDTDKGYFVEARLQPIARRFKLQGLEELFAVLRKAPTHELADAVVEAMTINETSFFRDSYPFVALRQQLLPSLLARRGQGTSLRIWSAAASTGQEAYSILFALEAETASVLPRVQVLGTDISKPALQRATEATYSSFEVNRGIPQALLPRYFHPAGADWVVKPAFRQRAHFQHHNLMGGNLKLGRFDIVFLRNVLIYFDVPTKRRILEEIATMLAPDGFLLLGGTESIIGVTDRLTPDRSVRGLCTPAAPVMAGAAGRAAVA